MLSVIACFCFNSVHFQTFCVCSETTGETKVLRVDLSVSFCPFRSLPPAAGVASAGHFQVPWNCMKKDGNLPNYWEEYPLQGGWRDDAIPIWRHLGNCTCPWEENKTWSFTIFCLLLVFCPRAAQKLHCWSSEPETEAAAYLWKGLKRGGWRYFVTK